MLPSGTQETISILPIGCLSVEKRARAESYLTFLSDEIESMASSLENV